MISPDTGGRLLRMIRGGRDPADERKTIMHIRNALIPLAGATLLLIGLSGQAQAYQCVSQVAVGTSNGPIQANALNRARTDWSARVKNALGLQYSVYDIADDKEESCTKVGFRYQCRVEAEPCAYVVQ